ncbi:MAG: 30S ribosomal protein S7 [Candidatus Diapherotrites archaeon]|nr:30S ribosomal protein S7 [Candidatus Diapherotrites archaeon]
MFMTKVFGKWEANGIEIRDPGLARYIQLESKIIPHSFGGKAKERFGKAKIPIVERLINKMMRSGQGKRKLSGKFIRGRGSTGKKLQAMRIVEKAFEIIEKKTNKNPIEVLIRAIENSAPREDVTRFRKGGLFYTQSVDVAPLRRLDEALKNLALAAFANSFNTKKSAEEALAEEIILASEEDAKSYAVKRRNEVERIAASSR